MAHIAHKPCLCRRRFFRLLLCLERLELRQLYGSDIEDADLYKPFFRIFERDHAYERMKSGRPASEKAHIPLPGAPALCGEIRDPFDKPFPQYLFYRIGRVLFVEPREREQLGSLVIVLMKPRDDRVDHEYRIQRSI